MNKEYKTSEAQRKAARKWAEEHKERKKELDRLHNIRRREKIKKEHQALLDIKEYVNKLVSDNFQENYDIKMEVRDTLNNILNNTLENDNDNK